ncbi:MULTISPECIES: hypothetical protein [Streptomyces]|uniref:Uncharacterized protein n=1 Tax=Streptomyces fimbriatus TaxID=68197 RepID=A0ABW0DE09_STRFI
MAAAAEIAQMRDQAWAVRELAQALDREPSPDTFADITGSFCDALCRDRAMRERVERMFAVHGDEPAALVQAWSAFLAECGSGTAMDAVDDDLADDVRRRLHRLRRQGLQPGELSRMRPDSFAHTVAFGTAVVLVHDAVRRSAPLSRDEAERIRTEVRTALDHALALPSDSDERTAALSRLAAPVDDQSWADRAVAGPGPGRGR